MRFRSDRRNEVFATRLMKHQNRLPREAVDTSSPERHRDRLDGPLGNLICCRCPFSLEGELSKYNKHLKVLAKKKKLNPATMEDWRRVECSVQQEEKECMCMSAHMHSSRWLLEDPETQIVS